jgi:hypothetical protein
MKHLTKQMSWNSVLTAKLALIENIGYDDKATEVAEAETFLAFGLITA